MTTGTPDITPAARAYLKGRPLLLRASRRHGCCGGTAFVPTAAAGAPQSPELYEVTSADDVTLYVERCLGDVTGWTVDAMGLWKWQRLIVDGATNLPPDFHDNACELHETP